MKESEGDIMPWEDTTEVDVRGSVDPRRGENSTAQVQRTMGETSGS